MVSYLPSHTLGVLGHWTSSGSELRAEGFDVPTVCLCNKVIYVGGAWFNQPLPEQPIVMKCLLYAELSVMCLGTQRGKQRAEEEEKTAWNGEGARWLALSQ